MHSKFNLLVIEDEELSLQPLSVVAESLGHRVFRADGNEMPIAVMEARKKDLQAVVLDWNLCCVTYGRDLVASLHEIDPEVPFIIVTGYEEKAVRSLLPRSVRAYFLTKPFLVFDFENIIRWSFPKSLSSA